MNVVVVGQGYVGLPLSKEASKAGHIVTGVDLNYERVSELNEGRSVVDDLTDTDISEMLSNGYSATSSFLPYSEADVVIICVPTPLGENKAPDLSAVVAASRSIAENIRPGTLVVLESTTYPGTTAKVVAPIFVEAGFNIGEDVFLAFSPERIDPGNPVYGLKNTPKVVGADDIKSLNLAKLFYSSFVDQVVSVSGTAEAELTKLLENTYRHVNIALVNEMAMFCRELGINIWEVIDAAATKPFGFQPFYPGPGVGGHCIPIDPNYLSYEVKNALGRPFRFVELAEEINSAMPSYVISRAQDILNAQSKPLNGSRILLLGVTYKSGISDTRESPASNIAHLLSAKGAKVSFYDPFIEHWRTDTGEEYSCVKDLQEANRGSDLTILLQKIPGLSLESIIEDAGGFLDTRGVTSPKILTERL